MRAIGTAATFRTMTVAAVSCCFPLLLLIVSSQSPATANSRFITNSRCPDGTREQGNSCVLDGDLTLTTSLELSAFTTLNCRGRRILPTAPESGTTPANVASAPAAAIIITAEAGVDIRNCIIG